MTRNFGLVTTLVVAMAALLAGPAWASTTSEVRAGNALSGQAQSGVKACADLGGSVFEHLGEYAMHQRLGRQAAGCAGAMGPGMMGAAAMMGGQSPWMADGRGQQMGGADRSALHRQMMGGSGLHTAQIVLIVLGVLALLGLGAAVTAAAMRRRHPPAATA